MSKHLRRLKNSHKNLLGDNSYNVNEYLYERDTPKEIIFVIPGKKGKLKYLRKKEGGGEFEQC